MACYKQATCGQFMKEKCTTCPASNRTFLTDKADFPNHVNTVPIPVIDRPLGMLRPLNDRFVQNPNEEIQREAIRLWLENHKKSDTGDYAVNMKPDYIRDNLAQSGLNKLTSAMTFMYNAVTSPELYLIIATQPKLINNAIVRPIAHANWPKTKPEILTPDKADGFMILSGLSGIDLAAQPTQKLVTLYTLVKAFDDLCETIFTNILTFFRNNQEIQGAGHPENIRLEKIAATLMYKYNASRAETINVLVDAGYQIPSIIAAVTEAIQYS